jgi:hypothetical protein
MCPIVEWHHPCEATELMTKRAFSVGLTLTLTLTLAACGQKGERVDVGSGVGRLVVHDGAALLIGE